MDKQVITSAAEAALADLELDCKVDDVSRSPSGDAWCVQFSGPYGQVSDEFEDQFGEENSSRVVREKIKRYLLSQVTKIRNSTGKTRRGRSERPSKGKSQSSIAGRSLRFVEDALNRASKIAGRVADGASDVAVAAQKAVTNVAENLTPVSVEIQSVSAAKAKKPRGSSKVKKAASKASSKVTRKPSKALKRGTKKSKSTGKIVRGSKRAAKKVSRAARRTGR